MWKQSHLDLEGYKLYSFPDLSHNTLAMHKALKSLLDVLRKEGAVYHWSFPFHLTATKVRVFATLPDKDDLSLFLQTLSLLEVGWKNFLNLAHSRTGRDLGARKNRFWTRQGHNTSYQEGKKVALFSVRMPFVLCRIILFEVYWTIVLSQTWGVFLPFYFWVLLHFLPQEHLFQTMQLLHLATAHPWGYVDYYTRRGLRDISLVCWRRRLLCRHMTDRTMTFSTRSSEWLNQGLSRCLWPFYFPTVGLPLWVVMRGV